MKPHPEANRTTVGAAGEGMNGGDPNMKPHLAANRTTGEAAGEGDA